MADLPFPVSGAVRRQVQRCSDAEGKLLKTLEALGPLAGRDLVLYDADQGWRARQLAEAGARVMALVPGAHPRGLERALRSEIASDAVAIATGTPVATGLPAGSADVIVSFWSDLRGGTDWEVAEADRVLRPGGRLLVVHEYGRDDLSRLMPEARNEELVTWSRRDGWFLRHGFKMRVIHAFWTFADLAELRSVVAAVFGAHAPALLADVHRPRLSWKLVVYHRTREEPLGVA